MGKQEFFYHKIHTEQTIPSGTPGVWCKCETNEHTKNDIKGGKLVKYSNNSFFIFVYLVSFVVHFLSVAEWIQFF